MSKARFSPASLEEVLTLAIANERAAGRFPTDPAAQEARVRELTELARVRFDELTRLAEYVLRTPTAAEMVAAVDLHAARMRERAELADKLGDYYEGFGE